MRPCSGLSVSRGELQERRGHSLAGSVVIEQGEMVSNLKRGDKEVGCKEKRW